MAYKLMNTTAPKSEDSWEHVSFINSNWLKSSDWEVRWRKADKHDNQWCANKLDPKFLTKNVWNVTETYWDPENLRLLLDVNRPFSVADSVVPIGDPKLTLDPEVPLQVLLTYGVWTDGKDTDVNKIRGDKTMEQI